MAATMSREVHLMILRSLYLCNEMESGRSGDCGRRKYRWKHKYVPFSSTRFDA